MRVRASQLGTDLVDLETIITLLARADERPAARRTRTLGSVLGHGLTNTSMVPFSRQYTPARLHHEGDFEG